MEEEAWQQKRKIFDIHTVAKGLKSGNTVKRTKSNLKEEDLKAVVCRCSSK